MTRLPGISFDRVREDAEQAHAAGAMVGRFDAALCLDGLEHTFQGGARTGVHDTPAHLKVLALALKDTGHITYPEVAELAAQIVAGYAALPAPGDVPLRVCHGDLKFNNLLFSGTGNKSRWCPRGS